MSFLRASAVANVAKLQWNVDPAAPGPLTRAPASCSGQWFGRPCELNDPQVEILMRSLFFGAGKTIAVLCRGLSANGNTVIKWRRACTGGSGALYCTQARLSGGHLRWGKASLRRRHKVSRGRDASWACFSWQGSGELMLPRCQEGSDQQTNAHCSGLAHIV